MSEDELFVMIATGIGATLWWGFWLAMLLRARPLQRVHRGRTIVGAALALSALALFAVLLTAASHDVRQSPLYLSFYMLMGAFWVRASFAFVPITGGISVRDDVVERGNEAAAFAAAGALLGLTLCFAGANIGDGPGWWVVVFSAGLSTAAFLALWWLVQRLTRQSDAITIDRDPSVAVRSALLLVALGLVLGRAVAGDWESPGATVRDFATSAWPAAALAAAESWVGRGGATEAPAIMTPVARDGLAPGFLYVALALTWIVAQGPW